MKAENSGALANIRVIDLSRVLGGPFCTQILGDHGADVIKVEPPEGDDTRKWGPPFLDGTASYFLGTNRNKRAIALDLAAEEGRDVLRALLAGADVLVENFKVGTMEKWGLGKDVLHHEFPNLIHCRITGFGADGPLGGLPGYDACAQAMCGMMSVNGERDGEPMRVGLPAVDMVTGLHAAVAILSALFAREADGRGQFIDATLYDCAVSFLHPHAANYFLNGRTPLRSGNQHPNIAPYETIATGEGSIFLAVGNDRQFNKLLRVLGAEALLASPDFATNQSRVANRARLHAELASYLARHRAAPLAQTLLEAGVPAAAISTVDEVLTHPHTLHRQMVVELGGYRGLGPPVKMSATPATVRLAPPAFAQHRDEILREAGWDGTSASLAKVAPLRTRRIE